MSLAKSDVAFMDGHADLLRVDTACASSGEGPERRIAVQPRSVIDDLDSWSEDRLASALRRKLRAAGRALCIRPAVRDDAPMLYRLYRESIARHRGQARYGPRYFEALCALAQSDDALAVRVAEAEGRLAGFIITACEDGVAYYLHGGFDAAYAALRPGYLLMASSIAAARDGGCHGFDMLTSPINQPSLVSFKEAFGARSSMQDHWDIPITQRGRLVSIAMSAWRRFS